MSVRLFVLGLVHRNDVHGYEIKETAKRWGVDRWARIGFGSIYHALGKLEEEGLILEMGLEQETNRPPRMVYRITESGTAAFLELLRQTCRTAETESRDIDMALAFIDALPPEERVALLKERLKNLEPRHQSLQESMAAFDANTDPEIQLLNREVNWVAHGVRHSLGRIAFEVSWMNEVVADVANWPQQHAKNQQKK
jgi:DNA-binding PadR family transcriptional regulator